jgi:hypothetical protein
MRDVTGTTPKRESTPRYIFNFLKHPVVGIARLPDWSWARLFWTQFCCAAIAGLLAGVTKVNIFGVIGGLILTPMISTMMVCLLTALLYYYFQVFEKRTAPPLKLFTLGVFSSLPFFIFQILSGLVPPVTLIGFAFSSVLLSVGLTENFMIEKRRAMRLAAVLFGIVVLLWVGNKISLYRMDRSAATAAGSAPAPVYEP